MEIQISKRKWKYMHLGNVKDSTSQSWADLFPLCSLEVPVTSGVQGSGVSLPYLRGHSANGGQVIPSAQEVWSVDLQLKVAQPLDNGL